MNGEALPPIGIPLICLKTFPPNSIYVLKSIHFRASSSLSIVYSLYPEYCVPVDQNALSIRIYHEGIASTMLEHFDNQSF